MSLFKEVVGSDRAGFVGEYPLLFLFGVVELQFTERLKPTLTVSLLKEEAADEPAMNVVEYSKKPPHRKQPPTTLALALRKRHRAFASMITVGRAPNNGLVIPDISVSKFHAYFRVPPEGIVPNRGSVELCDADSSDGSWVGDRRLPAKDATLIRVGNVLRFGAVALTLVDAAQLWDRVHEQPERLKPPTTS